MNDESNLPISEQYRIVSKQWVDAECAASLMEDLKSSVLNERMVALGDIPVNRAEKVVKASPEWREYVEATIEARRKSNLLKAKLEWIRMKHSEEQSYAATRRAEMKLV